MTVFQALGFMFLGGAIVELFEIRAWVRYQQGKREGQGVHNTNYQNKR